MNRTLTTSIVALLLSGACWSCGAKEPAADDSSGGGPTSSASGATSGGSATTGGGAVAGAPSQPVTGGSANAAGSAGNATGGNAAGGVRAANGGAATGGATTGGASTAGASSGGADGGVQKSAGCGVMDHPASGTATIDVAGTSREYILELPTNYSPDNPYRLIFGWHWRGGQASDVASGQIGGGPYYGLEKASAGTAIFVAPNGIDNGWANTGGRDLAFLRALLAALESTLCIDQSRIFSTGFSYGGMMSDTIGCDMADVFRAIAPMSGALYSGCTKSNTQPVAVWMSHGSSDDVVPLADGKAALDVFLKKNGCGAQTSATTPSPCVNYEGCSAGHPVTYCEFDGGHMPPSFANPALWDFFEQF